MNDLFDKLQSDLAERIKEHYAKPTPQSWRFGRYGRDGSSLQEIAINTGLAAFRRVRLHRAYAVDRGHALEWGAWAVECSRAGRNVAKATDQLANIVTSALGELPKMCVPWQRELPPENVGVLPPLPVDPCTKQTIRNPYLEPKDYRSIALIKELSPRLAVWLEECSKHGGQPTMAMLDGLAAEKIEADYKRKILSGYDEKMWEANLLRPDSGATGTEKGRFVRSIEADSILLGVHRHEAELGSPSMGYDNLSVRSAIAKRDPALREIHKQAGEILNGWQIEAREKAA
jgi:hypothetical protein